MKKTGIQMSESLLIASLLAFAGGFMDVYSYICRGHVFANAQTGNIVLLAVKFADREWVEAAYYIIPIMSFFVGIVFSEVIKSRFGQSKLIHWRQIIIAIEFFILLFVGFIPSGNYNSFANCLVSFVCSLQVQSFRTVNGNAYVSTMCTGNLRSASEQLYNFNATKDKAALQKSAQYFGLIFLFMAGAAFGAIVTDIFSVKAVWIACAVFATVFILMSIKPDSK